MPGFRMRSGLAIVAWTRMLRVSVEICGSIVVIFAGYPDRMETFFSSNPGLSSRVAHHLEFDDYTQDELVSIAGRMLTRDDYRLSPGAVQAFDEYLARRLRQPRFANARSIRNALERARLRQANRLVSSNRQVSREDLMLLTEDDIRGSRVFAVPVPTDPDAGDS
jgi:hypothetical protein